tara:strand:+ start:873 stop:1136 length:264 start_codon:yes stop_codon:yes gene_type:complete
MTFKVIEERLPVYWGSYLVNGDASGLDPKEIHEVEDTLQYLKDHHESELWCVDVKDDSSFEQAPIGMNWLLDGDYATYVFHTQGLKK